MNQSEERRNKLKTYIGFAKKAGSFIVQITVPSVSPYRLSFQGNRSQAKVRTPSPLRRLQPVAAAL